ncbi:MAG: hypothetical protein KKC84_02835 [Candidatus Omnitrophica bacterium]|nr:hypothetical protein [Candidatus Omnitrophota bacterium]
MNRKVEGVVFLSVLFIFCSVVPLYAGHNFYHGKKPASIHFSWKEKQTENFIIRYKNTFINPEPILKALSERFGIIPHIQGAKIRVYFDAIEPYTVRGARTIYVNDEISLVHELTHVLFFQVNPFAPRVIAEGIAQYAEVWGQMVTPAVALEEVVAAEKEYAHRVKQGAGRGTYAKAGENSPQVEKKLYTIGFYFVNNLIRSKGIGDFKEFYKKCTNLQEIPTLWQTWYGQG